MHNISIKIQKSSNPTTKNSDIISELSENIDKMNTENILINESIDLVELQGNLESIYGDDVSIRSGVSGGCYGASTGRQYEGLTLYLSPSVFPERVLDIDYGEIINPDTLIKEFSNSVDVLCPESFIDAAEHLGLEVKHDNSCNMENNFMFEFMFKAVSSATDESLYVLFEYHCGGDIRGNYSNPILRKFEYEEDFYSVLYPQLELTEEEE